MLDAALYHIKLGGTPFFEVNLQTERDYEVLCYALIQTLSVPPYLCAPLECSEYRAFNQEVRKNDVF